MICSFTRGAIFGIIGMGVAAAMIWYTLLVIQNFERADDISIALFFPHRRATRALYVLLASFILYAFGMGAGSASLLYRTCQPLDLLSKAGAASALFGILYFLYTMEKITSES